MMMTNYFLLPEGVHPENVMALSSAKEALLTHCHTATLSHLRNALKSAKRPRTASGSLLRSLTAIAFSTKSVMANLIVRLVLVERRNVLMDTKVSNIILIDLCSIDLCS